MKLKPIMISPSFQKRLSIWTIICVAFCSPTGDICGKDVNEVIDNIYNSPLFTTNTFPQESYVENEIPNELLSQIAHLSLPTRVQMLLALEYQNRAFERVELGGIYGIPKHISETSLVGMSLVMALLFIVDISLIVGIDSIWSDTVPALLIFLVATSAVVLAIYKGAQNHKYPGYVFCTDTGILIVEEGVKDKCSWLYYKDIQLVRDCLGEISLFTFKRFLRTIDKMGQVQDFDSSKLDPILYNNMVNFLTEKIGSVQ